MSNENNMTLATAEGGLQRTASRLSNRSGRSQNRRPSKLESVQYPAIDVLADQRGFGISPHLVYFKRGDPENPYNWSLSKKWIIVIIMCWHTFWVAGLGAIYIPATHSIAEEFGTSDLVARIPTATYLIGFSLGPVVWSPVAEDFGRKNVFLLCLFMLYIFQLPCALAQNIETLIISRFIGGFFGSAVFNSVALIPDLFLVDDPWNGWALNIWALSAESIVIAPIFGAYIVRDLGWRWVFWVSMIVGFGLTAILLVMVPETRTGILLQRRAKKLRKETGDQDYFAEHETLGQRPLGQMIKETLWRPVFMLFTEPIVAWFAIYDGLNYAIIYLAIEAVPIVYAAHGIEEPIVEFVFLSIVVGYLIAILLYPVQNMAACRLERKRGKVPESKLLWGFLISILFPISLYGFAWTALPQIHWIVSMIFLAMFGIASHILFLMVSDFTVESYGHLASSAVTGQSFLREALSAGIVIIGQNFYTDVRPAIATTILAAIATVLGVLPFVFFKWGPTIRARSSFSLEIKQAAEEEKRREDEELLAEKAQKEGTAEP